MRHTVIIPSYNTLEHLKNTYKSLKKYAPDWVDIIFIDDCSEDGTLSWLESLRDYNVRWIRSEDRLGHTYWYDEGMREANTETVSILHSDMIIGPKYFENMLKHLERGKVVCATRIEPPIHPAGKEKIVRDFGDEADTFKWDAFEEFVEKALESEQKDNTTRGIFAPWAIYKEDHFAVGGHDQRFAPYGYEDSDIFNRWILAGYEMIQSRDSFCYHMTCRGHKWNKGVGIVNPDYEATMNRCAREYIRKWGDWIQNDEYQYPIINPKYDIGFDVTHCNSELLEALEPWCSDMLIDDEMQVLTSHYMDKEQKNTVINLASKIQTKPFGKLKNDIIVYIDKASFHKEDFIYIKQLPAVIHQNKPEAGEFMLGNLKIKINKYNEKKISN